MDKLCTLHNVMMKRYTKLGVDSKSSEWWSHQLPDKTYCHGLLAKPQPAQPPPQPVPQPVQRQTSPIEPPKPSEIPPKVEKPLSKNLAFALSYAKDLVMGMQLPINLMFGCAEAMREFMDGEMKVDLTAFRAFLAKQDKVQEAKAETKSKKA